MTPERVITINGNKIEEYYWSGKLVVYVNNRKFEGWFEEAVQKYSVHDDADLRPRERIADCDKIVRRKSKRIERAAERLQWLIRYIRTLDVDERERKYLLGLAEGIVPYLKNDDKVENVYNYDNYNG